MKDFQAGVGLSRSWDPKKAGEEVAVTTLEKLDKNPKVFILYSTIHFDKEKNGMQKFVDAAYDQLPKGTPLIGGTVAGFINPYGCYTRGATGLAISYPNMDVTVGVGHNTKRNPEKAAIECAEMIKKGLKDSKYKNKFLFEMTSGYRIPTFPIIGRRKIIKLPYKILEELVVLAMNFSTTYLQIGMGKEVILFNRLAKELDDFIIIGGSCMDDEQLMENYQFFSKNVLKNEIIALGIKSDIEFDLNTGFGLKPAGIRFDITKKQVFDSFIRTIDNKPAKEVFMERMKWYEDYLDDRTIHRKTFQYPVGYQKNNHLCVRTPGIFFGGILGISNTVESDYFEVYTNSGRSLVNASSDALSKFEKIRERVCLGIGVDCGVRLEALGNHIYAVQKELLRFFGDTPFLVPFVAGEHTHISNEVTAYNNMSFNMSVFYSKSD